MMRINFVKVMSFVTLLCVYIIPSYFLSLTFGIDVTKYMFLLFSVAIYITILCVKKTIAPIELSMFILIAILCYFKKSIEPLSLIELMLSYRFVDYLILNKSTISKQLIIACGIGILVYSLLYFNYNGRFLYTGLKEINQSGFAIFLFAIIVRIFNKKVGNFCLLIGLLTFSRNYLLCLLVFLILEKSKNTIIYDKLYSFFNFKKLLIISIILLLFIASIFEYAYKNNMLNTYQTGFKKYTSVLDYSNYFRFSTNSNLIKMYIDEPEKLLTGIAENEFYQKNLSIVNANKSIYRRIKPHNYVFSYLRIYGAFSIIIFLYLNATLKKVVNKENYSTFFCVFLYSMFLGVGFNNYWLYLTLITLSLQRNMNKMEENNERNNNNN